jgi:hypothetical protein
MKVLRSPVGMLGATAIAAALIWGSGAMAAALPQSERLPTPVHTAVSVDYATDVVAPGSPFMNSRPTYDQ